MTYDYDRLYAETPDALGASDRVVRAFFDAVERVPSRVLDIGCGQGRDALFAGRLGHAVLGVDLSANGIRALRSAARSEELHVEGIVADITGYRPTGAFDIILFDRTLHMLPEPSRLDVLGRMLGHVAPRGSVLIVDERRNIPRLKQVFSDHDADWSWITEKPGYLFARRS